MVRGLSRHNQDLELHQAQVGAACAGFPSENDAFQRERLALHEVEQLLSSLACEESAAYISSRNFWVVAIASAKIKMDQVEARFGEESSELAARRAAALLQHEQPSSTLEREYRDAQRRIHFEAEELQRARAEAFDWRLCLSDGLAMRRNKLHEERGLSEHERYLMTAGLRVEQAAMILENTNLGAYVADFQAQEVAVDERPREASRDVAFAPSSE